MLPPVSWRHAAAVALLLGCAAASAQTSRPFRPGVSDQVKEQASAVLALMSYMVVPDVTTSSLRVGNAATGNPSIAMTQLGGGFTWSDDLPLYLEGNAAYVRFDPKFLVSNGTVERDLPLKWNGFSVTVGIGWDVPLAPDLVLRPIVMGSYGRIASDVQAGLWYADRQADADLDFLEGGKVHEYGVGGALMLDFERFSPERDLDLELRYTRVELRLRSDDLPSLRDTAVAENLNLWTRLRTPTGLVLLDRPLRSVLEFTHTEFLGSQTNLLGFARLSAFGAGLEVDLTAHELFVTRGRVVARYLRGQGVEGWSLGLAVSF